MIILSRSFLIITVLAAAIVFGSAAPEKNGILLVPTGPGKYHLYYDGHQDIITAIDIDSALIKKVLSTGSVALFDTVYDPAGFWGIDLARVIARTDIVRQGPGVQLEGMDGEIKIYPRHVKPEEKIFPNYQGRIGLIFLALLVLIIFLRVAKLLPPQILNYSSLLIISAGLFVMIYLIYLGWLGFGQPVLDIPWRGAAIAAALGLTATGILIFCLSGKGEQSCVDAKVKTLFYNSLFWWGVVVSFFAILYSSRLNGFVYLLAIGAAIILSLLGKEIGRRNEKKKREIEAMVLGQEKL
ncbi:MAG: hypothetical protein PHE24_02410 [Patescibacteria group bacterium]|nr:hypothetical protein [Patescibacteria group bacterium]